jgi:MFS family permease
MINCLISVVNVVVTFVAAPLVDRLGRKPLLLTSVSVMAVLTILMGFGIIGTNSVLSIVGTFAYITFFALGLGPIPFLIVSEVTQPTAKALAQSWGMTMNWLATFVVGFLFPLLKNSWIGGGVYFIFTFMCVVAFLFVKKYVPETKGTSSYDEVWKGRQI